MNKNLKLYPYFLLCLQFIAWMPVFFLYFSEKINLKEVILLEAIYYVSVVLLEVPSGYFSDVVGRKKTLIIASVSLCLACLFYLHAGSFFVLIAGQICFAGWMAFQSGTTTVFLFESLKDKGMEIEYGNKEAQFGKIAMFGSGFAALCGGVAGSFNLSYPYFITLLFAVTAVIIAFLFKEPKKQIEEQAEPFVKQLVNSFAYLKNDLLGWLFAYLIVLYVLAHVPYEFYQPYLKLLENNNDLAGMKAPFMSGLIYAITMFIGAYASGISMKVANKIGIKRLLILSLFIILGVVGLLGSFLHPVLIVVILFRNLPRSLIKAPVNSLITPKIEAGKRATFHSIISLVSRLSFFLCLFGLSFLVSKDQLSDWPTLSSLYIYCLILGVVISLPILFLSKNKNI